MCLGFRCVCSRVCLCEGSWYVVGASHSARDCVNERVGGWTSRFVVGGQVALGRD